MNIGIKSKTFNALGTPDVSPGVLISTALEPRARIIGIIASVTGVADSAAWALFASVGGVDTQVANCNISALTANTARGWWAGISGRYNDNIILQAAAANSQQGFWPFTSTDQWVDITAGATYQLKLLIDTNVAGNVIVFYTVDPPTQWGDST